MTTEKVHFTEEKETMLMTLYGRAMQSQWPNPILRDPWAEEAMKRIDYDTSKMDKLGGIFAPMMARVGYTVVATRAATFDDLAKNYLADHPNAVVLHLGCGMDSRVFRLNPPPSVEWFDVDYPDTVEVRKRLFPERPSYHLIGAPLDDLRWLATVPGDRPVLMIAEGVMHYLSEADVKALLNAVTQHFPGGELIFDATNSYILKQRSSSNVGNTGATYKWGLDDPNSIQQLAPKLRLVKEYKPHELVSFSRFPFWMRGMFRVMELNATLSRAERILVYSF